MRGVNFLLVITFSCLCLQIPATTIDQVALWKSYYVTQKEQQTSLKMSLKAYKKGELKEMLQKLKLADDGLKNDLEDRLQGYLDKAGSAIENLPELADFFTNLPTSPSTMRKAVRKSVAMITGEDSDGDLKTSEMLSNPITKRFENATSDLDISPSKVAQWASDTRKKVWNGKLVPKSVTKAIPSMNGLRAQLSQVNTIGGIAILTEAAVLSKALLPISYEIKLGGLGAVTIPDLYVALFGSKFWYPIATWIMFQLIPLIASNIVNPRADSVSKRYRKAHAMEYAFDPVVFAIAKLLLCYIAFDTKFVSGFISKQVSTLDYTIGKETFQVSAGVTLLFALYEAIL